MPKYVFVVCVLLLTVSGCTPGIYQRLDSSAPAFGPIYPGITRQDAERHLGPPLLTIKVDKHHYRSLYEYERERRNRDILITDIMDFLTCGLGNELISPIDRFAGTKHLLEITYYGADQDISNDRIVDITDSFSRQSPSAKRRGLLRFF